MNAITSNPMTLLEVLKTPFDYLVGERFASLISKHGLMNKRKSFHIESLDVEVMVEPCSDGALLYWLSKGKISYNAKFSLNSMTINDHFDPVNMATYTSAYDALYALAVRMIDNQKKFETLLDIPLVGDFSQQYLALLSANNIDAHQPYNIEVDVNGIKGYISVKHQGGTGGLYLSTHGLFASTTGYHSHATTGKNIEVNGTLKEVFMPFALRDYDATVKLPFARIDLVDGDKEAPYIKVKLPMVPMDSLIDAMSLCGFTFEGENKNLFCMGETPYCSIKVADMAMAQVKKVLAPLLKNGTLFTSPQALALLVKAPKAKVAPKAKAEPKAKIVQTREMPILDENNLQTQASVKGNDDTPQFELF